MLIYAVLPAALLLLGIPLCRSKKGRLIYCVIAGLSLITLTAIRFCVGYDYIPYYNWFNELPLRNTDSLSTVLQEKGFIIPVAILLDFVSPQMIFGLIALVTMGGVAVYIYRNSELPFVSFFVLITFGLWFNSMNFMRQFIAATIILYSLKYIAEKRFWRFAIFIIFASMFHLSALIMLPFFFIFRQEMTVLIFSIYTAVAIFCFSFSTQLISLVTNYFYTNYDINNNPEMAFGLPIWYTVGFSVLLLVAFLMRKMLFARSKYNVVLLNCLYFGVFFELIGIKHGVVSRVALFFLLPSVIILSAEIVSILFKLIKLTFKNNKKARVSVSLLLCVIMLAYNMGFYAYLLNNNYNGVLPYRTVFDPDYLQIISEGEE